MLKVSYLVHYDALLQNAAVIVTKCVKCFITKCNSLITECDRTGMTKCDVYSKMRRYTVASILTLLYIAGSPSITTIIVILKSLFMH